MSFGSYLERKQPVVYRIFANAIQSGRISHAYLLLGEAGTPLERTALYFAKSLVCRHPDPLADETCPNCLRLDKGEYQDFRFFDGSSGSIKKEEMQEVVGDFSQTPLEKNGRMVYVIHQIEAMTPEAANSLLKFLEEPSESAYAILTSQNEAKVLPTILSRCQILRLRLTPRRQVVDEALGRSIPLADAELLSYFDNDVALIEESRQSLEYQNAKEAFELLLSAMLENPSKARYVMEKDVTALLNSRTGTLNGKVAARYFFDMLTLAFQDLVAYRQGNPIELTSYATIIAGLKDKIQDPEGALLAIMKTRGEIETNINLGLLCTHLIYLIDKE